MIMLMAMRCDAMGPQTRLGRTPWMLKIKIKIHGKYCTVSAPYSECDNVPSRTEEKQPVFVKPTPLERQTKSVECLVVA